MARKNSNHRCADGPGASRRGVDMGPSALRVAGLQARLKQLGRQVEDIGNISSRSPKSSPTAKSAPNIWTKFRKPAKAWRKSCEKTLDEDMLPWCWAATIPSRSALRRRGRAFHKNKSIGMIWLDAHGDMNTPESSPSGNVHGMPLASIMGYGPPELTELAGIKPMVEPRNVALVGIRDLDAKSAAW